MTRQILVENLECRRLLAVTLDNGLAANDPSYFTATIGNGEPTEMRLGLNNYLTEYTAFLDLGPNAQSVLGEDVVELSDYATEATAVGSEAVSTFLIILADDDDATDPLFLNNPVISGEIRTSIPFGSTRLVTNYTFDTFRYDLTEARFVQYWNGASLGGEDFLIVDGSVPQRDLRLRVMDTATINFSELRNEPGGSWSVLSGYGADDAASLRADILGGGYDPGPFGQVNVPAGSIFGIGDGYGPDPAIGVALVYTPLSSGQATIRTSLALSPGVQGALMEVFHVTPTADFRIPDDTRVRSVQLGTDFGSSNLPVGQTNFYVITNRGMQDLVLSGTPRVQVSGDISDFRVTRQPTPVVSGGGYSYFFIEFTPTTPGLRTALITIHSSDPTTSPFTFQVYGGTGLGIEPDIYENDGNSSDPRLRYFDPIITPQIAKQVSADGVWKVHTIHEVGDIDWSTFVLREDSEVYLQTTSARGDMRMYLYDAWGNQVGYDDNSGVGQNPAMILRLAAGTYYVRVDEFGNNSVVPIYALSVRAGQNGQSINITDDPIYLDGNGNLIVRGTDFDDTISADIFDGTVRITLNSAQVFFPIGDVKFIFINGRGGNDTIYVGPGIVSADIRGAGGDDIITVETSSPVTIFGGEGNDTISGGSGNDYINGKTGRDVIYGNDGDDYIMGGRGNDLIYGGNGNDTLFGHNGDDMLDGGEGDDLLVGGFGNDWLYGGPGNDTLNGELGQDVIDSGSGANFITAQDGEADLLYVSFLNDIIFYDENIDTLVDITDILA